MKNQVNVDEWVAKFQEIGLEMCESKIFRPAGFPQVGSVWDSELRAHELDLVRHGG